MKNLPWFKIMKRCVRWAVIGLYVAFPLLLIGCSVVFYNSGTIEGREYRMFTYEKEIR